MIPSAWALCIASSVAMLIKLNGMVQFQTWESGLHILITNEVCRGSVQVCFPVKQEDKENICNADCILYALWVDPQWRGKGGGNYMLRAAEYNSKLKGAKTIALTYHSSDTPKWVLDWYIANGYQIKDEDEEYKVLVKTL